MSSTRQLVPHMPLPISRGKVSSTYGFSEDLVVGDAAHMDSRMIWRCWGMQHIWILEKILRCWGCSTHLALMGMQHISLLQCMEHGDLDRISLNFFV